MERSSSHERAKARRKALVRAVVCSWVLADPLSTAGTATQAPTAASGDAQRGKELYAKYSCYACHGYDGHGGAGARLVPMPMTLPRFTAYVRRPRQMPPYTEHVLSDAQLADLFAYISSIPASPAARDIPLLTRIINGTSYD
jgi:mono/diheme cytochrome c family protein